MHRKMDEPIVEAAREGDIYLLAELLDGGENVNKPARKGITALMAATANQHVEIVKILINKYEADVNYCAKDGTTALHCATQVGNCEIVKLFINAGALVNKGNNRGMTPLLIAFNQNHRELMFELIRAGAKIDEPDKSKYLNPLIAAFRSESVDDMRRLIYAGARVDRFAASLTPFRKEHMRPRNDNRQLSPTDHCSH